MSQTLAGIPANDIYQELGAQTSTYTIYRLEYRNTVLRAVTVTLNYYYINYKISAEAWRSSGQMLNPDSSVSS